MGGNCLKSPTTMTFFSASPAATHRAGIGAIDASSRMTVSNMRAWTEARVYARVRVVATTRALILLGEVRPPAWVVEAARNPEEKEIGAECALDDWSRLS